MPIKHAGTTYYTLTEVAEQVQCSRVSIYRWQKKGKVPLGRRYRDKELLFNKQELQAVYAYAHRLTDIEAAVALKNQLKLLF